MKKEKLDNKKREFQEFMKDKGKKALEYFKNQNDKKKEIEDDIKKLELKNNVRKTEKEKSKILAENYREVKNLEKQKQDEDYQNYNKPNVIQKIYNRLF